MVTTHNLVTARIRKMREGNSFSLFTLVGRGVPRPRSGWGVPHPRSRRGLLHPRSRWAVPHPRSGQGKYPILLTGGYPIPGPDGGTPSQIWMGVVPHPRSGWWYPILLTRGYPIQDQEGDTLGHPSWNAGWGTPYLRLDQKSVRGINQPVACVGERPTYPASCLELS